MVKELKILPDDFLDNVWAALVDINDDSSRDEAIEAVDAACDIFNEYDPKRFPLVVDGEVLEEDET